MFMLLSPVSPGMAIPANSFYIRKVGNAYLNQHNVYPFSQSVGKHQEQSHSMDQMLFCY